MTKTSPPRVAVASRKGGVGKTATATNLAAVLAEEGLRVLGVDLDPQGHFTMLSGRAQDARAARVFLDDDPALDVLVQPTRFGYDLLTGGEGLAEAEQRFATDRSAPFGLRQALEQAAGRYDVVILDCAGVASDLTSAALMAATRVVVPCTLDVLSLTGLGTIGALVQNFVRRGLNKELELAAVLETFVDMRSDNAKVMHGELVQQTGSLLLRGTIRNSSYFRAAAGAGMPITHYLPKCDGAQDYRAVVTELHARGVL